MFTNISIACKRSSRRSSPGSHDLLYEILRVLINLPSAVDFIVAVYNDALTKAIFPPSWYQSLMTLLPKNGDLSNIAKYRPISLVNIDSKLFTRLLNSRIMAAADQIVNEFQTGFMPDKFIGENGILAQMVLEDAQAHGSDSHSLGLLLDQEKAYDRVNLDYLRQVLLHYGFPETFVNCEIFREQIE
ncbi:hypothetical protein G6F56_002906 [Rhizopus delemar]|nr:hypothetical protein G6F56_002906 [Rhizopus delemar]